MNRTLKIIGLICLTVVEEVQELSEESSRNGTALWYVVLELIESGSDTGAPYDKPEILRAGRVPRM